MAHTRSTRVKGKIPILSIVEMHAAAATTKAGHGLGLGA
jgi:hypothetical protein